jgi:tetraacyldisaccharide 4'-kinase
LPVPVISIGNLAVGGTGKTPMTIHLAQALMAKNRRVGILTRGYGGSNEGKSAIMVSIGNGPEVPPQVAGDEAVLLAEQLKGVPVAACAKRVEAGRLLLDTVPVDVLLLDDGFQHLALQRDADLVLLDAAQPFGNGMVLPRGPLREQPKALARADVIALRGGGVDAAAEVVSRVSAAPVVSVQTKLSSVTDVAGNPVLVPPRARVVVACGIARPERFLQTLKALSVEVAEFVPFADHAAYTEADVTRLVALAKNSVAVLVTAKDAVKLAPIWPTDTPLWVVHIDLQVTSQDDDGGDWVDRLLACAEARFAERSP